MRLKNYFKKYPQLFKNFSSLTILQLSNYIFPLITFPYLTRVLGVENFGLANFVLAFGAYFITITDYGFNFSATREISIFRDNPKQIRTIFWSTLLTKIIITVLAAILYIIIVSQIFSFSIYLELYLIGFLFIIGQSISPIWFLQGIERMEGISIITISIKAISVVLIFIFINSAKDVNNYILILSLTSILTGLIILFYSIFKYNIHFYLPKKFSFIIRLKKGWHLFLSTLSMNLYTTSNAFILGIISGNVAVGYFATANKIREAVQGLLGNFGRTIYPFIGAKIQSSQSEGINFIKKYLILLGSLSFIISLLLFLFAPVIVELFAGKAFNNSIAVLQIMAFLPFIITLSNIFGIQIMLNLGYNKEFNKIITTGAILNIVLLLVFILFFAEVGAAITMFSVEIVITGLMIYFVIKKKIFNEV